MYIVRRTKSPVSNHSKLYASCRKPYARNSLQNFKIQSKNPPHPRKHPGILVLKKSSSSYEAMYTQLQRMKVIALLGGRCRHCRITDHRVLNIDHIHGGGEKERKKILGRQLYLMILNGSLPLSRFQILCANCNWIKYLESKR